MKKNTQTRKTERSKALLTYRTLKEKEKRPPPEDPRQLTLFSDFISPFPKKIEL